MDLPRLIFFLDARSAQYEVLQLVPEVSRDVDFGQP